MRNSNSLKTWILIGGVAGCAVSANVVGTLVDEPIIFGSGSSEVPEDFEPVLREALYKLARKYPKAVRRFLNQQGVKVQSVYNFTDYPDATGAADDGNTHPYPSNGDQPYASLLAGTSNQAAVMTGKFSSPLR